MCTLEQRASARHEYPLVTVTDRNTFRKLSLQIERDLLTQKRLKALLADVDAVVLDRRRELRSLKARMAKDERT